MSRVTEQCAKCGPFDVDEEVEKHNVECTNCGRFIYPAKISPVAPLVIVLIAALLVGAFISIAALFD